MQGPSTEYVRASGIEPLPDSERPRLLALLLNQQRTEMPTNEHKLSPREADEIKAAILAAAALAAFSVAYPPEELARNLIGAFGVVDAARVSATSAASSEA